MCVPGRGGGTEVAADAAAVADLRGRDGVRGEGEAGQRGAQALDDLRVRHARTEPDRVLADLPLAQQLDAGEVHEVLGAAVVEVDLDHHIGAAGDGYGGRVRGLGGERLFPGGGAQEVHTRPMNQAVRPQTGFRGIAAPGPADAEVTDAAAAETAGGT